MGPTEQSDLKLSRRQILKRSGILTAGAVAVATMGVVLSVPAEATTQGEWIYCTYCRGIFFDGYSGFGVCYGNNFGDHSTSGSLSYYFVTNEPNSYGQHGWAFCKQCYLMHYSNAAPSGNCPVGVGVRHAVVGSGNYAVEYTGNNGGPGGQLGWGFCGQCRGLWWAAGATRGACPGYSGHVNSGATYLIRSNT